VAFYKKWKYLLPAIIPPALLYIIWDIFFTYKGVWQFNEKYITGFKIVNLPVEEVLFFLLVPYCCVFIYECTRSYFPNAKNKKGADVFLKILAFILMAAALVFYTRYYTSWTFGFLSLFIIMVYLFRRFFKTFDAFLFLVSYAIILIPFLIVNGFLTAIPIVCYNNTQNLGIRLYTIPFEDVFYGMLLMMLIICLYERMLRRNV
jgi:lycopene cyclase domain-containing protein